MYASKPLKRDVMVHRGTQRIEPRAKRHQMTISWIRFIEGGTISVPKSTILITNVSSNAEIDFGHQELMMVI